MTPASKPSAAALRYAAPVSNALYAVNERGLDCAPIRGEDPAPIDNLDTSTAYKVWSVGPADMKALIAEHGEPVPIVGKPGSLVVFDCNLLHASGHNLSAQDRWQAYFCFNKVANRPVDVENPRPDYVRSRNWTPLQTVADDAITAATLATA